VVAGQAVGAAVLIASAAAAALGLFIVATRWVGLLGLFPLTLGIYRLVAAIRKTPDNDTPVSAAAGLSGVAGVAVINGADNITIYTPMFRHLQTGEVVVTLAVFVVMIGIWCAAAAWLGAHLSAVAAIRRLSHRLVPIVLIAVGAAILSWSVIG
jgi:cadmium resistance protein CadD (predicted permease)